MSDVVMLIRGREVRFDERHAAVVAQFKWWLHPGRQTTYVRGYRVDAPSGPRVYMHRLIIGAEKGAIVDHRDHNGLNNTDTNLRLCTARANAHNQVVRLRQKKHSKFKGVTWSKTRSRWVALICAGPPKANGFAHRLHLGSFRSEEQAAQAYDAAARKHFGPMALVNFNV